MPSVSTKRKKGLLGRRVRREKKRKTQNVNKSKSFMRRKRIKPKDFLNVIPELGRKSRNLFRKTMCPKGTKPLQKGEKHFLCSNYMGPGTRAKERIKAGHIGINSADRAAMEHDLAFDRIANLDAKGKLSKKQIKNMTRSADKQFVRRIRQDTKAGKNKKILDKISAFAGATGITAKMKLEDLGLLNHGAFSTHSKKKKKSMRRKNKKIK